MFLLNTWSKVSLYFTARDGCKVGTIYVKMHVHIVFNQNEYPRMELGFDITIYDLLMNMPIDTSQHTST